MSHPIDQQPDDTGATGGTPAADPSSRRSYGARSEGFQGYGEGSGAPAQGGSGGATPGDGAPAWTGWPGQGADGQPSGSSPGERRGDPQPPYGQAPYGQAPYGQQPSPPNPYQQPHQQYQQPYQQPYQQGYGYPGQGPAGYGRPPGYPQRPSLPKGLAIAAFVLGLLGLLGSWFLLPAVLGLAGLVLGVVAIVRARRGRAGGLGFAVAGVVLGTLSLLAALVFALLYGTVFSGLSDACGSPFGPASSRPGYEACVDAYVNGTTS